MFKKFFKFIVAPFKLLWKIVSAPFRNRHIAYVLIGTSLSTAWVYYAYTNPNNLIIEIISITCMTSVISKMLKVKGDGFGSDLINAVTGTFAFITSAYVWAYTRELSLLFGLIFIPVSLMDIDKRYLRYSGARYA